MIGEGPDKAESDAEPDTHQAEMDAELGSCLEDDELDPALFSSAELVEVAAYLGAAGLAGVIGNRADVATTRLFRSVRRRWRRRKQGERASLTIEEAIDAARAAVSARGFRLDTIRVISASSTGDDEWDDWNVTLQADDRETGRPQYVTVKIPWGDPANAVIGVRPYER